MSYQENPSETVNDCEMLPGTTVRVKTKPKIASQEETTDQDFYIEISLPNNVAVVQSGQGNEWTLSDIPLTTSIQEIVIQEGNSQSKDYEETSLNTTTYSCPKRVEIYTVDDPTAPPYLVFQEVINKGVTGWQIYAPVPFIIQTSGGNDSWMTAISSEYVTMKQVVVFDNCNYSIQQPPPPGAAPLFDMGTQSVLTEVDIQS
ncbi:MAG: hypothetical protein LUM44_01225 [Pyrinomonadaceae bacterium]|nr:hypothetical protein [Pyrinomonadaceae bacterium]